MRSMLMWSLVISMTQAVSGQLISPFTEELIEGYTNPVDILFEDNGRGYVVERHGLVWIIDENGQKVGQPLVDIREETVVFGDHGLLSLALHPEFRTNGYLYLLYVVDRHYLLHFGSPEYNPNTTITDQATIGRITRYTADPATDFTTLIDGSRKVLVGSEPNNGFPILMASHGIGTIAFGTDGSLLASCGDGGSFLSQDVGSAPETFFAQALEDGILRPKENIGSYKAQLIDCMNGKILRMDPETGDGLPSNPFFDESNPGSAASKVWALGFRQPFRFVVRPESGSHDSYGPGVLYVGDVGGGLFEELNVVTEGGQNFGWPLYEGFDPQWGYLQYPVRNADARQPAGCPDQFYLFKDLVKQPVLDRDVVFYDPCLPTITIPDSFTFIHAIPQLVWSNEKYNPPTRAIVADWHANGQLRPVTIEDQDSKIEGSNFEGSSSIPGFFYRGDGFPEEYQGKLFLADFTGWIKVLNLENDELIEVEDFHSDIRWVVDLDVNPITGEVYHVNMNDQLYRISYGGNSAPQAVIKADKYFGPSPLEVQFDATNSTDRDGDDLTFLWKFGDGTSSTDPKPVHGYVATSISPESFEVQLTVTDSAGAARSAQALISLNNTPPQVQVTSLVDGGFYSVSGTNFLPLEASVTDLEHSTESLSYAWHIYLHHNDHFHAEFPIDTRIGTAVLTPAGCTGEVFYYRIRLEVTDPAGLTGLDEVIVHPYCGPDIIKFVDLTATTSEQYIDLTWDVNEMADIASYSIERALGFGQFMTLNEVAKTNRSFRDSAPVRGELRYRIRAIAADGIYQYSNEVIVDYPNTPPFSIYPNPASEQLFVEMSSTNTEAVQFELFHPDGRRIMEVNWLHTATDTPLKESVFLPALASGVYFYTVTDGSTQYHGSVLVGP